MKESFMGRRISRNSPAEYQTFGDAGQGTGGNKSGWTWSGALSAAGGFLSKIKPPKHEEGQIIEPEKRGSSYSPYQARESEELSSPQTEPLNISPNPDIQPRALRSARKKRAMRAAIE